MEDPALAVAVVAAGPHVGRAQAPEAVDGVAEPVAEVGPGRAVPVDDPRSRGEPVHSRDPHVAGAGAPDGLVAVIHARVHGGPSAAIPVEDVPLSGGPDVGRPAPPDRAEPLVHPGRRLRPRRAVKVEDLAFVADGPDVGGAARPDAEEPVALRLRRAPAPVIVAARSPAPSRRRRGPCSPSGPRRRPRSQGTTRCRWSSRTPRRWRPRARTRLREAVRSALRAPRSRVQARGDRSGVSSHSPSRSSFVPAGPVTQTRHPLRVERPAEWFETVEPLGPSRRGPAGIASALKGRPRG